MNSITIPSDFNSRENIARRFKDHNILWIFPALIVLARPVFALLSQGITVIIFNLLNDPTPYITSRAWWTVYGTWVDIGCLIILALLVRREGIRLFDLISFDRDKWKKDLLLGLGLFIIVFPLSILIGSNLASILVYGSFKPDLPPGSYFRELPLWAVLYSRLIWWVIWSPTEELTYNGYALPRLIGSFKKTWPAVMWVGFGWAVQHSFLPYINWRHAIWLFIMFLPLSIVMQLLYLHYKRLFPLIVMHWCMDFFSVLFLIKVV